MLETKHIPFSLYLHFPWCIKKCPYCDFNSHTRQSDFPNTRYIEALLKDVERELSGVFSESIQTRPLVSIFMGGGTPSLFSSRDMQYLLKALSEKLAFSNEIEITLEANPGSTEYDDFSGYIDAGINRLSLGIQSFDDAQLKFLGRIHDSHTADKAIKNAQRAGFENINLDLMFGLKNQTVEQVQQQCQIATDYDTHHLSFYQLTIEPHTLFAHHPPKLPQESIIIDMQQAIQQHTCRQQFTQYEVSAYSKQSHHCRHNMNYWQFGDYLGIGAGAHSKITHQQGIHRFWKQKHPQSYLQQIEQKIDVNHTHQVANAEIDFEFLMNALRLKQGFEISRYEATTGKTAAALLNRLQPLQDKQLLDVTTTRIKCTPRGYQLVDEILQSFLP